MIKFDKLWIVMKKKGISQYKLINEYGISRGQLSRIKKNENVTTNTLDMLCDILNCEIEEIMEHVKENR